MKYCNTIKIPYRQEKMIALSAQKSYSNFDMGYWFESTTMSEEYFSKEEYSQIEEDAKEREFKKKEKQLNETIG